MRKRSFGSSPRRTKLTAFVVLAASVVLAVPCHAQDATDVKLCRTKTKTMACTLEQGVGAILGAVRANAVAAGGPLAGKCQIDSPAVAAETRKADTTLRCDDASVADTGDTMIALCKAAATAVRANCRTVCSKLDKIDPLTGDPVEDAPCHQVIDRTVVTTKTDRYLGPDGCRAVCEASIVCVCDP